MENRIIKQHIDQNLIEEKERLINENNMKTNEFKLVKLELFRLRDIRDIYYKEMNKQRAESCVALEENSNLLKIKSKLTDELSLLSNTLNELLLCLPAATSTQSNIAQQPPGTTQFAYQQQQIQQNNRLTPVVNDLDIDSQKMET